MELRVLLCALMVCCWSCSVGCTPVVARKDIVQPAKLIAVVDGDTEDARSKRHLGVGGLGIGIGIIGGGLGFDGGYGGFGGGYPPYGPVGVPYGGFGPYGGYGPYGPPFGGFGYPAYGGYAGGYEYGYGYGSGFGYYG